MIDNQESEYISCTKLLILKKVLVRASVLEKSTCKSINTSCIISNEILHEHEWLDTENSRYMDSLPFGDKKIGQKCIF